jgi:hypothetical protein
MRARVSGGAIREERKRERERQRDEEKNGTDSEAALLVFGRLAPREASF